MRPGRLFAALVAMTCLAAGADEPPLWQSKPRIEGIIARVPVLTQPMPAGWHPTLFWWQVPLAYDDPATLKQQVDALTARGLLPCVELNAEYNAKPEQVADAIAEAKALAAIGCPVHLAMKGRLDLYRLPDGSPVRHAESPDAGKKDAIGAEFPCLPLRTGWEARAEHIRGLFRGLADAGVPVAGVWYDYEGHPHPWNGIFPHSRRCPACRQAIPPKVLDSVPTFATWVFDLRHEALDVAFAQPVRAAYPKAEIGFYGYVVSSEAHPAVAAMLGLRHPPTSVNPADLTAVMPVCYAGKGAARRYFNADWPVTQRDMDAVYFAGLVRGASNVHWNLRPDQFLMPYVSGLVGSKKAADIPPMSRTLYREFLLHAILRGSRGFYCFNVAPPYGAMDDFYQELADISTACNSAFASPFRDFLNGGAVLNDEWPDPKDANAVVWSGLAKGDRAVVRVITLAVAARQIDLVPFPGSRAVRLNVLPGGATYLVTADGKIERVTNPN